MAGTFAQDKLAIVLLDDDALDADVTGDAVESGKPAEVRIELVTGDVASTASDTLDVEIQGADNEAFDEGVVSYGKFSTVTGTDDDVTRYLQARVYKPWIRAVATVVDDSSSASFPVTVTVRTPHDHRTTEDSA